MMTNAPSLIDVSRASASRNREVLRRLHVRLPSPWNSRRAICRRSSWFSINALSRFIPYHHPVTCFSAFLHNRTHSDVLEPDDRCLYVFHAESGRPVPMLYQYSYFGRGGEFHTCVLYLRFVPGTILRFSSCKTAGGRLLVLDLTSSRAVKGTIEAGGHPFVIK